MSPAAKRQVVILSSIDWETAWQRHQIFASQLAESGHEVFFINNTGFRNPELADLPRVWSRIVGLASPTAPAATNRAPAGLRIFSPKVLPPTFRLFRALNASLFIPNLITLLRSEGLRPNPIVICYFATATTLALVDSLQPSAVVYDCASNFRGHPKAPADFRKQESDLLRRADAVVCDSDFLYQQKKTEHANVHQIHQGVAEEFFRAKPPFADFRRFCYYGTWVPELNPEFLQALAVEGLEVTLSGFMKGPPPPLPESVRRLPPAPREKLLERLQDFDAFLLPHRITPFMLGVVPAKIYECLAMGRPVISVPLPSLLALRDYIYIAETPEDWVRVARDLPRTETPARREARIALAREHTHRREFERFRAVITGSLEKRSAAESGPEMDLVALSPLSWSRAPQARRTEAIAWAASGRRVFFVELGGERGWARRLRRSLFGARRVEVESLPPGLELVPAFFLPASRRLFREANAALLAPRLADLLHDRGLGETFVAVRNGPSPHSAALLDKLRPALVLNAESDGPRTAELMAATRKAHPRAESPVEAERLPAFLSGLGWIGILYGFAKVSIFLTQMFAGRWLGPAEYGRANLALAAAAYLQIVPMLGFPTAMGKYLASETEEAARGRFVSTALAAFAAWVLLCLPFLILARRALSGLFDLPPGLFAAALFLAASNAVYVVVASSLLGLKKFAHRGLVETAYGLSAPLALLTAVFLFGPTYEAMIGALGTAFLVGAVYALWCQRRYLVPAFEPKVLETVWRYAAVASLNLLAVAFVLAPARFILHARRGPEEVGLFSAYFTATIQIALALLYMLQSVIVPMASDPRGQRETWELIKRRALPTLLGAWLIFMAGLIGALAIFGRRYPLRWDWALAFSGAAALALAHGTLSALYSARDFSGLRISVAGGLLTGLINAALAAALIPRYGVSGAAVALAAGFTAGLIFFVSTRRFERA